MEISRWYNHRDRRQRLSCPGRDTGHGGGLSPLPGLEIYGGCPVVSPPANLRLPLPGLKSIIAEVSLQ
ncbi:MAG TPA: hypothetical protein VFZ34_17240 [Blastocatellia bacterium]|nr:hypothetical protein [Blastocatellia bacterium]